MKKEVEQENLVQWVRYLVHREQEQEKRIDAITQEIEEINRKLHIVGRSLIKLYKTH